jgi:hypothetical protein
MQQGESTLQTIGIMGTETGCGVTHLSIMLGNYITAKLHKNIAIIEMNSTGAFLELKDSYVNNTNKYQEFNNFEISQVTYYYNVPWDKVGKIYSKDYKYIIMDMGTDNLNQAEEFLKCNIKIIIGNLTPWSNKKFIQIIENFIIQDNIKKIKFLVQFGACDVKLQIKEIYNINLLTITFEPDPFLIHGCNFDFLENLLT